MNGLQNTRFNKKISLKKKVQLTSCQKLQDIKPNLIKTVKRVKANRFAQVLLKYKIGDSPFLI